MTKKGPDETLGERLRAAIDRWWTRRAADESSRAGSIRVFQQELSPRLTGEKSGSSYQSLLNYLNDLPRSQPSLTWLTAAADILDVRIEWLAFGSGEMTAELQRTALTSRETAAARLKRWRSQRGEREATLFAWSGADEGPDAWAVEAVMRFDDLLDAAGVAIPHLQEIDGESARLHLLAAALRHLRNAVAVFSPRPDTAVQTISTAEGTVERRTSRRLENLSLRSLLADPRGSRAEYGLWADQELRVFAGRIRGLGVRMTREERGLASQEMVEAADKEEDV